MWSTTPKRSEASADDPRRAAGSDDRQHFLFEAGGPAHLSAAEQDAGPKNQRIDVAFELPAAIELVALLIEGAAEETTLGHGDGRDPIPMELMAGQ